MIYFISFKGDVYDSDDSYVSEEEEDDEEEDDGLSNNVITKRNRNNTEHSNPNSYSWNILRLSILKITVTRLQEVINIAGIEIQGIFKLY